MKSDNLLQEIVQITTVAFDNSYNLINNGIKVTVINDFGLLFLYEHANSACVE